MTPFYSDSHATLFLGDCREVLPSINAVDHVITDPPYEAEAHTKARRFDKKHIAVEFEIDFAPISEDVRVFCGCEFARVASRWVLVFCQVEAVASWRTAIPAEWIRAMVWIKPDGTPQLTGDRPAQGYESIATAWAGQGKPSWNAGGKRGVYTFNVNDFGRLTDGRPHPTMKPLSLMRALVEDFTDPGETILDPFCGSGTTGVAAKMLGRKAILVEREERYAEVAAKRLAATHVQERLTFDAAPIEPQKRGLFG